jgi:cytochrome P450
MLGMGTMSRMKADVLGTYQQLHRDYGDAVHFRTGPFRLFLFFHPDQVRELLVTQSKSFTRVARVMETFAQWNGDSILIVEGEKWVRQRRLVQPAFQPRRFAEYGRSIVTITNELTESWQTALDRDGFVEIDTNQVMTALTLQVICRVLFDVDATRDAQDIAQAVAILSEVAFYEMQAPIRFPNWWPTAFHRRKREAMKTLDDFVWKIIRERRAENNDHGDLLSMLLAAVDEEGDGGSLDDRQVRNESMTLMLAGHDTTAAALDWVWYSLARYPEIAAKCQAETDEVLSGRDPVATDVPRLKFIEATIKEALRIYPPAIGVFLRQATEDVVVGGYSIPRGSLVGLSSFVTHRDPRWFPDPLRFDPDRFLPPNVDQIHAGAYFPFGMGPRVCIGQSFAMTEMILIVSSILQKFTVELATPEQDPGMFVHMALRPRDRLPLRFRRRDV